MIKRSKMLVAAVGAVVVAGAALFSTAASAGGKVGWNVTIGGPGFAVSAGQPYYGAPYRPYYRPYAYYRPAPVYRPYYRSYYRPYYPPRPVYYAQPVVVAPSVPYYPYAPY